MAKCVQTMCPSDEERLHSVKRLIDAAFDGKKISTQLRCESILFLMLLKR